MVDVTDFKNAMSMLSAAVNVVTTDGPAVVMALLHRRCAV